MGKFDLLGLWRRVMGLFLVAFGQSRDITVIRTETGVDVANFHLFNR